MDGMSRRGMKAFPRLSSRFATMEPNGLLLYNGRFNEKHDFIAMEIIKEQIQLTYSAGRTASPPFFGRSPSSLWLSCLLLLTRRDQDHGFSARPRRRERRPVARGGGALLQQGTQSLAPGCTDVCEPRRSVRTRRLRRRGSRFASETGCQATLKRFVRDDTAVSGCCQSQDEVAVW